MHNRSSVRATLVALCFLVAWPAGSRPVEAAIEGDPIDLVIVLDVSGTMRGLIDATRLNLWEIVNDLAEAEPTPHLRVALITYGNQLGSRRTGWVRVATDLTDDLDLVAEQLFQLKSRGADEMVGRALRTALEKIDWSASEHALKLLFIAGNESADQDPEVRFRWMSEAARDAGIFVSAVFCGTPDDQEAATWKEMAELSEGRFATIEHRAAAPLMATPFDQELAEFGDLLNGTFVPVGKKGAEQRKARARQDKNARKLGLPVAATRAQTKGSPFYASSADLVSLYESGGLQRFPVAKRDLPKPLRRMTDEDRLVFLQDMQSLRQEIRERIQDLSGARRQFLAEQRAEQETDDARSFDRVVRRTIRDKAEEIGYSFPDR